MSGNTSVSSPAGDSADDLGPPRRRSFLKFGGATLLAGGAVASTAAARQPAAAKAAAQEARPVREAARSAAAAPPSPQVPPDLQSLVPIPAGRPQAAVDELDQIVKNAMTKTGVPGVAVAVVHGGSVLYARGFGIRNVNTKASVDASTVFQLASVSKSLSSTVVAGAVGKKIIGWADPVTRHLPGFALADPYVTSHVTYADLFSHVSGLPDHAGDLLEDLGYSQAYILNRLRLEPLGPFRAQYEYTNFGLTTAAVAAAGAAGHAWADLADEILFGPAAMRSASFRYADFAKQANRTAMHVRVGKRWVQKYTRDADPEAPAGGASASVLDLANWMILQLASGKWKGKQVIGDAALSQAHLPHALSGLPSTPASRSGFYGYGTNVSYDYAGRLRLSHSGGFAQGAATAFTLLPSVNLGIVTLTNGMPIGIPEAINNYFMDYVEAGSVQDDWLTLYGQAFASLYVNHSELAGKKPPKNPVPAKPASFYTGTYANSYYGPIRIVEEKKTLHLLIGPRPENYVLQHWSGNLFAFYPTGENAVGITAATFTPGAGGKQAKSVTLEYYNSNPDGTPNGLGRFIRS